MKRLCVLLCAVLLALAFGAGCGSEDGPLGPAIRDWNGDNMQMRGFSGGAIPPSRSP